MNKKVMVLFSATMLVLAGCIVTSVHPFYTANDAVYEPLLIGGWTNVQESDEHWMFSKEGKDFYRLAYVSSGKTNLTQAHLFKLKDQLFLDVAALGQESEILPPPVPTHLLLRVFQIGPTVRMAALNHDWLKALLEKDPKMLLHKMIEEPNEQRVVLTAETKEIQAFLNKHLTTEAAWKDTFELKRDSKP
jgi:hypothetical protein